MPLLAHTILQALVKEYNAADTWQADMWQDGDIIMLIASDTYWKVTTGKIDHINEKLIATEITFGWMVQRLLLSDIQFLFNALFLLSSNSAIDLDVSSVWCLDAIGIDGTHS